VPWILVPRCTFSYHYFPSVPFVAMMVVYVMVLLVKKSPKWLKWVYVYCAAAFLLFLLFYPVLSGEPVSDAYVRDGLKWMSGWVLVI
jgi:dolichyl-phosphate-mannose--protein O-mannosyl transferase